MDDLISRKKLLSTLAVVAKKWAKTDAEQSLMGRVFYIIEHKPEEVVRCKDCRWYEPVTDCGFDEATGRRDYSKIVKKDYGECHGQDFVFTEDGCLRVGDNDFCSYGERKEGDGDD